jgi:SulP family sulfate permease
MRLVPVIDASGVHALQKLADRCHRQNIVLIVSGLQDQPNRIIARMHWHEHPGELHFTANFDQAIQLAKRLVEQPIA